MKFRADTTLKYFGIPLTGGDGVRARASGGWPRGVAGGLAGYAVYAGLFGSAIGMGNYLRYVSGDAKGWQDEIYIDHIQPWMMYGFLADEDGNLDLYVTNAFEQIFRSLVAIGVEGVESKGIHKGWMKIENVDVVGSRLGVFQETAGNLVLSNGKVGGSLNMVFRAVNPLQVLAPIIREVLPGAIGAALYYGIMADSIASTMAAMAANDNDGAWPERPFCFAMGVAA